MTMDKSPVALWPRHPLMMDMIMMRKMGQSVHLSLTSSAIGNCLKKIEQIRLVRNDSGFFLAWFGHKETAMEMRVSIS